MAYVLTTGSTVHCGHGGAVSTEGAPKLKVAGKPVLRKAGIDGKSVAASCALQDVSDTSGPVTIKCTTVMSVTDGEAKKLKVGGAAVMLDTLAGGTNGMKTKPTLETRVVVAEHHDRTVALIADSAREVARLAPSQLTAPPRLIDDGQSGYVKALAQLGERTVMILDFGRVIGEEHLDG